jgi:hypothetical protein
MLVGSTLTIQVSSVNASLESKFDGFNFSSPISSASFTIRPSAIGHNSTVINALFVLYNDARLFPSLQLVSTSVVDATLVDAQLNGTMQFAFKPSNFNQTLAKQYVCAFWTANRTWSSVGLSTVVNEESVECETTHLTNFAVIVVGVKYYQYRV